MSTSAASSGWQQPTGGPHVQRKYEHFTSTSAPAERQATTHVRLEPLSITSSDLGHALPLREAGDDLGEVAYCTSCSVAETACARVGLAATRGSGRAK